MKWHWRHVASIRITRFQDGFPHFACVHPWGWSFYPALVKCRGNENAPTASSFCILYRTNADDIILQLSVITNSQADEQLVHNHQDQQIWQTSRDQLSSPTYSRFQYLITSSLTLAAHNYWLSLEQASDIYDCRPGLRPCFHQHITNNHANDC